ncbi:dTDP-fucosamine acetyltransferase [compost metagenome]
MDEFNRKGGVGRSLIHAAIAFARQHHAKVLTLETAVDNYNAQQLYEKIGFERQSESDGFYLYAYTL